MNKIKSNTLEKSGSVNISPKKKLCFYAGMFAVSVIVSVVILEIFCSLASPIYITVADYFDNFAVLDEELGYKLVNNFKGLYKQDYELFYSTNSHGLRDHEFSDFPKEGVKRILAIGDSWTFGPGVEAHQTWPKQLEKILKDKNLDAQVINSGVSGYGTRNYNRALRKFYPIYHPDIVIVLTFDNDLGNDIADSQKVYSAVTSQDSWLKTFLKRRSHLAKNLWFIYQGFFPEKYGSFYATKLGKSEDMNDEIIFGYKLQREALIEMRNYCMKNNIFLAVASLPHSQKFHDNIQNLCYKEDINFISLQSLPEIKKIAGNNSAGHYNPQGYYHLAKIIADFLEQSGGLK